MITFFRSVHTVRSLKEQQQKKSSFKRSSFIFGIPYLIALPKIMALLLLSDDNILFLFNFHFTRN